MIQPLFNPFQTNKSKQYTNIVPFNIHEIKVEDEQSALQPTPPTIWQDDYQDQLLFELRYYNLQTSVLDEKEWLTFINSGVIHSDKNLLLSIFTRNCAVSDLFRLIKNIIPHTHQFEIIKAALPNKNYESIHKDIKRTFKSSEFFRSEAVHQRLTQILIAYANMDTQLTYAQGMNFFVGGLLYLERNNDELIFDLLRYIVLDKDWRTMYVDGTPGLFMLTARFSYKFKKKLPELAKHLQSLGLEDLSMCISPYYLTLFMQHSPLHFALVILCMFLVGGEEILGKILLAMLKYFSPYILSIKEFQKATEFIKRGLLPNFYRELQICRKEQRLIKILLECGLLKKPKQGQKDLQFLGDGQKQFIQKIIQAPIKFGSDFYHKIIKKTHENVQPN